MFSKGGGNARGSRSRGGRSNGFGNGGTSKYRSVRGHNNQDSGYRNNFYAIYTYLVIARHSSRHSYLHNRDPKVLEAEEGFDCGNGKYIRESQVCDWVNDCGNGVDERVPLPCEGKYSSREIELYISMITIYSIWLIILYIIYKTSFNSEKKYSEEEKNDIIAATICISMFPSMLLFINIIFITTALVNETSIIIEYYITSCVFTALACVFSLCICNPYNIIACFILFIISITTMFNGSIHFSYIPTDLASQVNYSIITNTSSYSSNTTIYNILKPDGFWETGKNEPSTFIIDFKRDIYIEMIMIYPTYPNKTTDQFKIYTSLNTTNWTNIVSGPMPIVLVKSALEMVINSDTTARFLKFQAFPVSNCNNTIKKCNPGLDELKIYEIVK